ncbi:uncharacterized protein EV420DRAFT_1639223 [Desarmillaria tabescens]|uniref:Uncharacterized protein n=1 Tax=Armillaria tabescens TaxID=1929756 RepID=A0AA39TQN4_ARMTA|nr:uncharacterized protein EV420DRAFT_1639223 [Desarmillaria tabescens]KAK0463138.1 hypothetical protein EV420DRAFT_1639223 [Desarmillaria tabescens]
MNVVHAFRKDDLLKNSRMFSGSISFNDGLVGALFPDPQFFITSPTSKFIPSPSTTNEVRLYADGHFGDHDYGCTPQYYEEAYCHLPLIPHWPTSLTVSHPYQEFTYMWDDIDGNNDIEWMTGSIQGIGLLKRPWCDQLFHAFNHIDGRCQDVLADRMKSSDYRDLLTILLSCLQAVLDRLGHVAMDTFTIQVLVTTAQRFWLEIVAALDYMGWCKPVMDGIKSLDPAHRSEYRIGAFTWDVGTVQLFFKAQIPVFFVHPLDSFANQVILQAVDLSSPNICSKHPKRTYPTVFTGKPSDPRKYVAQHQCLHLFQGYCDPFNFCTIRSVETDTSSASAAKSSSIGPICLERNISHCSNLSFQSSRLKKNMLFNDIGGDYAPPALPAWSTALMSINERSERATASFPEPAYLRQLDHCLDALKFQATAIGSDAVPLCPQQCSSKSTHSPSIKAFEVAEKMLGLCMQGQEVQVQLVPPPSSSDEQPFNVLRGHQLIWELCKLNFRYELLALDHRVFCAAEVLMEVTTAMGAINDSNSNCQNAILVVFSGNSLIPPAGELLDDDGFGGEWEKQRERLRNLWDLMQGWSVPLPMECKGLMGPTETEGGLTVEKALAMHYAQTFFDFFGRPPVLPRHKPADKSH